MNPGIMIAAIAIIMGVGIGMLGLWLDYRNKRHIFELHHQERMAAIEKGLELSPLPMELFQITRQRRTRSDYLRRGLLLLLMGLAITAALAYQNRSAMLWGMVPCAAGLAYLLFYKFERPANAPAPRG